MKSRNVLNKAVNVCGKVVGERQEQLSQLYERGVVRKARVIVDDNRGGGGGREGLGDRAEGSTIPPALKRRKKMATVDWPCWQSSKFRS